MREEKRLSERERYFCRQYAATGNCREAAARAGYRVLPEKAGLRLLERPEICERVQEYAQKEREAGAERVRAGYERLAFGGVADAIRLLFLEEAPDLPALDAMELSCIAEIKRPKGGGMEIKFYDRLKALERLQQMQTESRNEGGPFYEALERGAKALAEQGEKPS